MKRSYFVVVLFLLQNYLITNGIAHFSKLQLPFLIFFVSAAIACWYFIATIRGNNQTVAAAVPVGKNRGVGFLVGAASILVLWKPFMNMFTTYPDPGAGSDVIPQLVTQFNRFSAGEQPYRPLEQLSWHPFPVYMPLHWLPTGLGNLFKTDVRWVGFVFMALAAGLYGRTVWAAGNAVKRTIAILLPASALGFFMHWAKFDLAISYEVLIAAYYLVLCAGLISGNLVTITVGIVACLLSRYTFVFWLPLFFVLLWHSVARRKSLLVLASIAMAVLLLYVAPFYLRDPSILSQGLQYHNKCYVDSWNGYGRPERSTAFDAGLNFSWFIREYVSGTMAHRVTIARIIQGSLMMGLLAGGIAFYRRVRHRISYHHFSLGMLYCFMLVFFMFSPITFLYYYIPLLVISGVLCGMIIPLTPKGGPAI